MSEKTIWIVTDDIAQASGSLRSDREIAQERGVKVSVGGLEKNMSPFLQSVGRLFHQAEQQAIYFSGIQLDEIEVSIKISKKGEVKLIGTGGKGTITLKG